MILNQSRHPKPWRYKNASSLKQIYKHFNQKHHISAIKSYPSTIILPLARSHLTTIKANFLTSNDGGVNVDPGYDGDFNIMIQ